VDEGLVIAPFLPICERIARKYEAPPLLEFADLYQEACLAALLAIRKFDARITPHLQPFLIQRVNWAIINYQRHMDPLGKILRAKVRAGTFDPPVFWTLQAGETWRARTVLNEWLILTAPRSRN
jgi:hypothetical protein